MTAGTILIMWFGELISEYGIGNVISLLIFAGIVGRLPVVAGQTLSIASEKGGYALTDRGTFLAYQSNVDLEILVEGDPFLLNVYHVITVNPEKWPDVNLDGARAFADFITSAEGQKIIEEFGVEQYGEPLFFPDANKTDAELGLP